MAPYLTVATFKPLTVMPSEDVDALEAMAPGFLDARLASKSRWIDARLAKRYAVPFESPYPEAVTDWLARIVTLNAYVRRGINPNDEAFVEIKADADKAEAEIKEAADSQVGLFELPLLATSTANGVTRGGPLGYSEQSPYVGFDEQSRVGRIEDGNGRGTRG